ncbi:MAG: hypothetical protein WCO00_13775 [Rhodospirillaceae bacterium]
MDDESPRKRSSPSRDSLDILRRVEPVLLRVASDVITLRQGALDLIEVAGGHGAVVAGAGAEGGGREVAESAQRLSRGLDELAETHQQVRRLMEQIHEEQRRLAQTQARQMDGADQLLAGQSTLIDGVEQLREDISGHHAETGSAHDVQAVHLQGLRLAVLRLTEEQESGAEGQRVQAERIARLEERVRRQAETLSSFRRELRSLPMLMTLAALVFAVAGAAVVVLKVRLS